MYSYEWDTETGGYVLNNVPLALSKEPRPVYYKELDILGFDKHWKYEKCDFFPYMWAEANNYYYRGKLVAKTKGGSVYQKPELILVEDPEPDGEYLRYVDIPAMVEKNREIMESLAQETIKKIYNYFIEYRKKVDVFYVAFSGGKDSVVTLDLVSRALPHNDFKVLFGDTGMEFPDTYETVNKVEEWCASENIDFLRAKSELDPEYTWKKFGPPAQTMRWCCSVHKSTPQILLLRKITSNPNFKGLAFTGVRGDESASRSEYDTISLGEKVKGQYSCHPILEWNTAELFLYIYENNLVLNDAYKKGNSRAGCLVCPLAAGKNTYFKEVAYCDSYPSTSVFNRIIIDTTEKDLSSDDAIKEYMNIGGWKARRSGKELNFSKRLFEDNIADGILTIVTHQNNTDWREWFKTIGRLSFLSDTQVNIEYANKNYLVSVNACNNKSIFTVDVSANTQDDILFASALKTAIKKATFCIGCRVCEANCPNGFISFENGAVVISDQCVKCRKCHEIQYGCLVANSLRLPKEEKKMGAIDRYGNFGVEYKWLISYFKKKDEFWDESNLGKNMIKSLKCFLNDSLITEKNKFSSFGKLIDQLGIENVSSWGLILSNLAYTSEFNWWIKNIKLDLDYLPESINAMLTDVPSENSRSHIISAYKNIFISITPLSQEIGLGICDYDDKNGKRFLKSVRRTSWIDPDPKVILYSLYLFAEKCGGYYNFTLNRLLNHDIDSDGISPTQIFGLDRDTMTRVLNGLASNYPEFIAVSFTIDLDNIYLKGDKTSADVLEIF